MGPSDDDDAQRRARIDGRVVFAAAAFALAMGLLAVVERVGAPVQLVSLLGPGITLVGIAIVTACVGSMRPSRFLEAGKAVPARYAGLAMLSVALALFACLAPRLDRLGVALLYVGFAAGLAIVAAITAPLLRASGAPSLLAFLTVRFPGHGLRLLIIGVVALVGALVGLAGLATASDLLAQGTGAGRGTAVLLVGVVVALVAVPGGLAGILWAGAAASGILLASLLLPVAVTAFPQFRLPLPAFGDEAAWSEASSRMSTWSASAETLNAGDPVLVVIATALGIAVLAPLLAPLAATPGRDDAKRSGIVALLGGVVLGLLATAAMAMTALAVDAALLGHAPDRLPAWIYAASGHDALTICGRTVVSPVAARLACASAPGFSGTLQAADVHVSTAELLTGLAQAKGLGVALSGLTGTAITCLQLAAAAAGFFVLATAAGPDGLLRRGGAKMLASPRLALTRALFLAAVAIAMLMLWGIAPAPEILVGLAVALSAAVVAPLMVLARWTRAGALGALLTALVGLAVASVCLLLPAGGADLGAMARAAVFGFAAAVLAGVLTARAGRRPTPDVVVKQAGSRRTLFARKA